MNRKNLTAAVLAGLAGAAGLIVRSGTQADAKLFDAAESLKVVGRAGVGLDNIDLDAATRRGVAVLNAPAGNTVSTAELAFALLLSAARHIPPADRSLLTQAESYSFGAATAESTRAGAAGRLRTSPLVTEPTMPDDSPIREFMETHYRHFNAAAMMDAARAYRAHVEAAPAHPRRHRRHQMASRTTSPCGRRSNRNRSRRSIATSMEQNR